MTMFKIQGRGEHTAKPCTAVSIDRWHRLGTSFGYRSRGNGSPNLRMRWLAESRTDTQQGRSCMMEFDLGWSVVDVVSGDVSSTESRATRKLMKSLRLWDCMGISGVAFPHIFRIFRGGSSPHRTSQSTVNLRPRPQRLFSSEWKTECLRIRVEPSTGTTKGSLMGERNRSSLSSLHKLKTFRSRTMLSHPIREPWMDTDSFFSQRNKTDEGSPCSNRPVSHL